MSVNFQQVTAKIRQAVQTARQSSAQVEERRALADLLLKTHASRSEDLRRKVEQAATTDPNLRCAIPLSEPLNGSYPAGQMPTHATLLAADGSQINPDRHSEVLYSLVNVGVITYRHGSGEAPQTFTYSELQYGEELFAEGGLSNSDRVALSRDLAERQKLLEHAQSLPQPLVAFNDGTLEMWGPKDSDPQAYRKALTAHLAILSQMRDAGVTLAGVVDKPGANLVLALLEVASCDEAQLQEKHRPPKLQGVSDRKLFRFLPGGERSAIFGLQSSARAQYSGDLAVHFFYLNSGSTRFPSLLRVEIPTWVANQPDQVNLLHACLLHQCRILGDIPYPYLLHRAHELAVVNMDEKQQVEQYLIYELHQAGVEVDMFSNKQRTKNLPKRGSGRRR